MTVYKVYLTGTLQQAAHGAAVVSMTLVNSPDLQGEFIGVVDWDEEKLGSVGCYVLSYKPADENGYIKGYMFDEDSAASDIMLSLRPLTCRRCTQHMKEPELRWEFVNYTHTDVHQFFFADEIAKYRQQVAVRWPKFAVNVDVETSKRTDLI